MALVPIKTSTGDGYCECIHGCYDLVSLRDEDTGKGYCPFCAKEHLEWNRGLGLPNPPPVKAAPNPHVTTTPPIPEPADPPGRLRDS